MLPRNNAYEHFQWPTLGTSYHNHRCQSFPTHPPLVGFPSDINQYSYDHFAGSETSAFQSTLISPPRSIGPLSSEVSQCDQLASLVLPSLVFLGATYLSASAVLSYQLSRDLQAAKAKTMRL